MMLFDREVRIPIKEQRLLIDSCINDGLDLEKELEKIGKDYDSLSYIHSSDFQESLFNLNGKILKPYKKITDSQHEKNQIPVVSFFSGGGGLDLGFEAAGFNHLASIEINELFCNTIRHNRPDWLVLGPPLHSGDIQNKEEYSHLLREKVGIKTPFEGVFHGGPPCQPFSIASNQRFSKSGENFKRTGFSHTNGNLLFDFVWYIIEFKPRVFLIENVPGLLSIDDGIQIQRALEIFNKNGYNVITPQVINSADFGVPQNRSRAIILGTRSEKIVKMPEADSTSIVPCYAALTETLNGIQNHLTREHKADSVARYMKLLYGQRDQQGRVDRLNPLFASKTIIAGGTKGGGRSHLHPEIPRTLSVRESARIQTFPDNYIFQGPSARQFTQVGNAVPPLLAMQLARSIYESVFQ